MGYFAADFIAWGIMECVSTAALCAIYLLSRRLLPTSHDRFLLLKVALCALPFLPLLAPTIQPAATWVVGMLSLSLSQEPTDGGGILAPLMPQGADLVAAAAGFDPGLLRYLPHLILGLYLTAVGFLLARLARSHWLLQGIIRRAEPLMGYKGVSVLLTDAALPPAAAGLMRPVILLPRLVHEQVDGHELEMILEHEWQHLHRRDQFFHLVIGMIGALLFFSPFIGRLRRHLAEEMELSCDALALERGRFRPRAYGELLLRMAELFTAPPVTAVGGIFISQSNIARRIIVMQKSFGAPGIKRTLLAISGALAAAASITVALSLAGIGGQVSRAVAAVAIPPDGSLLHYSWRLIPLEKGEAEDDEAETGAGMFPAAESQTMEAGSLQISLSAEPGAGGVMARVEVLDSEAGLVIMKETALVPADGVLRLVSKRSSGGGRGQMLFLQLSHSSIPEHDAHAHVVKGVNKVVVHGKDPDQVKIIKVVKKSGKDGAPVAKEIKALIYLDEEGLSPHEIDAKVDEALENVLWEETDGRQLTAIGERRLKKVLMGPPAKPAPSAAEAARDE